MKDINLDAAIASCQMYLIQCEFIRSCDPKNTGFFNFNTIVLIKLYFQGLFRLTTLQDIIRVIKYCSIHPKTITRYRELYESSKQIQETLCNLNVVIQKKWFFGSLRSFLITHVKEWDDVVLRLKNLLHVD